MGSLARRQACCRRFLEGRQGDRHASEMASELSGRGERAYNYGNKTPKYVTAAGSFWTVEKKDKHAPMEGGMLSKKKSQHCIYLPKTSIGCTVLQPLCHDDQHSFVEYSWPPWWGGDCGYPHVTDSGGVAQRGYVVDSWSHSWYLNLGSLAPESLLSATVHALSSCRKAKDIDFFLSRL